MAITPPSGDHKLMELDCLLLQMLGTRYLIAKALNLGSPLSTKLSATGKDKEKQDLDRLF